MWMVITVHTITYLINTFVTVLLFTFNVGIVMINLVIKMTILYDWDQNVKEKAPNIILFQNKNTNIKVFITRRASLVSNSFSYYKTEGLRVKDEGWRTKGEGEGEGRRVKDEGWRFEVKDTNIEGWWMIDEGWGAA